ncbi:MAG: hypothetical protein FJ150_05240 [Euryarchaeota archaeon]|nr:hypothetical protein [Euryarchaeota archaeon]
MKKCNIIIKIDNILDIKDIYDTMEKKTKILVALLIIAAVAFISYIQIFGLSFEGKESDFYVPTVTGDNISEYKKTCSELNLSQVSKDFKSFNGQKVKVKGQIQKKEEYVQFDKKRTTIVLKVPELSPDPYILVSYSSTIPFKEGDIITVYGVYEFPVGTQASQELANKNLPAIKAAYIEKA